MKSVIRIIAMVGLFLGLVQVTTPVKAIIEGPGFEMWNGDTVTVWFDVTAGNNNQVLNVAPNASATMNIDVNASVTIKLYMSAEEKDQKKPSVTWTTKPSAAGKTKYFTFNRKKYDVSSRWIYPQEGTLGGLYGRSRTGRSLSSNIKEADYGV